MEALAIADLRADISILREWATDFARTLPSGEDENGGICASAWSLVAGRPLAVPEGDEIWDHLVAAGFDEWLPHNRAAFEAAVVTSFEIALQEVARQCGEGDEMLRLHRLMLLPYDPLEALAAGKRDLGTHWSHSGYQTEEELEFGRIFCSDGYGFGAPAEDLDLDLPRGGEKFFSFEALVPVSAIDWRWTLVRRLSFWDMEREINVRDDAEGIQLVAVRDGEGRELARHAWAGESFQSLPSAGPPGGFSP